MAPAPAASQAMAKSANISVKYATHVAIEVVRRSVAVLTMSVKGARRGMNGMVSWYHKIRHYIKKM